MRKDTPTKMIWLEEDTDSDILFTGWHCPNCKNDATYQALDEYNGEYCPFCGQRIIMPNRSTR